VHLLAHDLADLIALFAAQVELAVRAFAVFAVHLTAVAWAVERATHRATCGMAMATVGRAAANIRAIRVLRMVYLLVSFPVRSG
jgi:hypothetical protein